jgi:hypothetical protein
MRVILISGDGHGAGKTFLARKFAREDCIFSIANLIRAELRKKYPNYDWYNKDPRIKTSVVVRETKKTIHEMLVDAGHEGKSKNPLVWAQKLAELIQYSRDKLKLELAVIDDVRFEDECIYLRSMLGMEFVTHFHIVNPKATPEPQYNNEKLKVMADYRIKRSSDAKEGQT